MNGLDTTIFGGDGSELSQRQAHAECSKIDLLRSLIKSLPVGEVATDGLAADVSGEDDRADVVIDLTANGYRYVMTRTSVCGEARDPVALSARECEVTRLVAHGLPNKAIAATLDISPWTVASHLRRIFAKLDVNKRADLVRVAIGEGIIPPT